MGWTGGPGWPLLLLQRLQPALSQKGSTLHYDPPLLLWDVPLNFDLIELVEGQRWGCLPEQVARQSRTHSCLVFWTNGSSCSLIYPGNVLGTSSYTSRVSWPALAVVVCSAFYSPQMGVSLTCCPCPALFSHIMCLDHCWDVNVVRMWEVVKRKHLFMMKKGKRFQNLKLWCEYEGKAG